MALPILRRIRIYPIKACAGVDVAEASIDERGLRYDRRWMLVNAQGSDLHQFDHPRLASVVVALDGDHLVVHAPDMPLLHVPVEVPVQHTPLIAVRWHEGSCEALPASDEADTWFQAFLRIPCRLVFMPEGAMHTTGVTHDGDACHHNGRSRAWRDDREGTAYHAGALSYLLPQSALWAISPLWRDGRVARRRRDRSA